MRARPRSGRSLALGLLAALVSVTLLVLLEVTLRWLPSRESRLSLAVILERSGGLEEIQRAVQEELRTQDVDALAMNRIYEEDDVTFWRLRRGLTLTGRNYVLPRAVRERYPFTVTLDAEGFRGAAPLPRAKAPGALRVAAVGDSSTFGWGVGDDETYAAGLARRLAAAYPGRPVEVMNAGIPGFSSFQGLRLLEADVLPRAPDYVILGFGFNDSRRAATTDAAFADVWSEPTARAARVFRHLATYRWLEHLLAGPERGAGSVDESARPTPRVPIPEFKINMREMLGAVRTAGARPILLALIMPIEYRAAIAELAKESNTPLLSTLALLQTRMTDPTVRAAHAEAIARHEAAWRGAPSSVWRNPAYADRIHPSAVGHDLIAEWLAEAIVTMEGDRARQ
jgi:lysophospholipase L1-like esterase